MKASATVLMMALALAVVACDPGPTADKIQRDQQAKLTKEATAQTGMPAIKNFRERKLLKDILELRDQDGLTTYTYTFAENSGQLRFFCNSIGYGIPYATQYTNPQRPAESWETHEAGNITLPQADPNGLFSPADAEGTWIMCLDPKGGAARPVYIEPRVVVSPFKLE